jgi:hypothetical protein
MHNSHSFKTKKDYLLVISAMSMIMLFTLFLTGSKDPGDDSVGRRLNPAPIISAAIPSYVIFCNENIFLSRLDLRERFDREINALIYLHSSTLLSIKRANRYFPIIEPILKANDIPDDFKYLCVIESGLDTRALSTAKAAGLWQFMESTAKEYGLEIREEIDERYHIEKSTEAACKYFKDAYYRYGNWINVAASYNGGQGRISAELQKQYMESALDLLLISETSRYIFRILAMKEIFSDPQKYGFIIKRENLYPTVNVNYVEIRSGISDLAAFAKDQGISYMLLKDYNVWLRDTKLSLKNGQTYRLAIPRQEDLYFNKNRVKIHNKAWIAD